jgi:hypothetical protein
MISRRAFVLTSLAGSAGLLSGCGKAEAPAPSTGATPAPDQPPLRANTSLELYFVGGTAFRKVGTSYVAIQPRGKGVVHDGHPMDHRSYLVAPYGTFGKEGHQFPSGYDMTKLHPNLSLPPSSYEAVCLVGKDVEIDQVNGGREVNHRSTEVAAYGALAAKYQWTPRGDWAPNENGPVCSRFAFDAGDLIDGRAVNQKGYAAKWSVGGGEAKTLSDVAILQLRAEAVSIAGVGTTPVAVPPDKPLALYVFGGPDFMHSARRYRRISHALLLKTIYDVKGATDDEIMPASATEVEAETPADLRHPCDFGGTAAPVSRPRVPPDTEYCVNYDQLP